MGHVFGFDQTRHNQPQSHNESPRNQSPTNTESGSVTIRHADNRSLRRTCDRCYQQKLRCVGNKQLPSQCLRCRKAGMDCVYSARASRKASKIDNLSDIDWQTLNDPLNIDFMHDTFNHGTLNQNEFDLSKSQPLTQHEPLGFELGPANMAAGTGFAGPVFWGGDLRIDTPNYSCLEGFDSALQTEATAPKTSPTSLADRLVQVCQLLEETLRVACQDETGDMKINNCKRSDWAAP
jgi:hypothetical protein